MNPRNAIVVAVRGPVWSAVVWEGREKCLSLLGVSSGDKQENYQVALTNTLLQYDAVRKGADSAVLYLPLECALHEQLGQPAKEWRDIVQLLDEADVAVV